MEINTHNVRRRTCTVHPCSYAISLPLAKGEGSEPALNLFQGGGFTIIFVSLRGSELRDRGNLLKKMRSPRPLPASRLRLGPSPRRTPKGYAGMNRGLAKTEKDVFASVAKQSHLLHLIPSACPELVSGSKGGLGKICLVLMILKLPLAVEHERHRPPVHEMHVHHRANLPVFSPFSG